MTRISIIRYVQAICLAFDIPTFSTPTGLWQRRKCRRLENATSPVGVVLRIFRLPKVPILIPLSGLRIGIRG